ncbi:MAG: MarR family transcriptional regulator [Rhodothermales bacterium]|nr:MarR family transcriptional regulator [Rhodothermales bacterium]
MTAIEMQGRLLTDLFQLNSRMLKRVDHALSFHGISHTEFQILTALDEAPGGSMARIDLARAVGMSASGVTRLLAPMEKLGMVKKEKHPRDARKSMMKLSDAGRRIREESAVTFQECAEDIFMSLNTDHLEQIDELIDRL